MQAELSLKAAFYRARQHHHKTWRRIVTVLASIVVFCTTYALILPAITMEPDYICGLEAHIHEDVCYQLPEAAPVTTMVCDPTALGIHEHTEDCYTETGALRCGIADFVLHTHSDDCYDAHGEPVCPLLEIEEHIHTTDACWQQPHVHEELCYTKHQGELLCAIQEDFIHSHEDACYIVRQNWLCQLEEAAPHTHNDACYTQTQELTCKLEVTEGHAHSDTCYDEFGNPVCGLPEIAGHAHTGECYQVNETFTCKLEETEGHTHSEACYEMVSDLTCTQEAGIPHAHGETCYAWTSELTCTQLTAAEGAVSTLICDEQQLYVHTHEPACYDQSGALICGLLEVSEHTHGGSCFAVTYEQPTEPVLVCGLEVHEHSETCLPEEETADSVLDEDVYCGLAEHTHLDICWAEDDSLMCTMTVHTHEELCWLAPADTSAVETEEEWLADLPELTYDIAADLIAVAESQLGYEESAVNYIVTEDGEILYYSRYADWWSYGEKPYGDWNAKFVAFCLENASIPSSLVPVEPETATWPNVLAAYDQWRDNDGTFAPITADLVFFDTDNDGTADRAGIITEVDTENSTIRVILERRGLVQEVHYDLDDGDILGYARIPGNGPATVEPNLTEAAQNVIDQIDALPTYDEIYAQLDAYYEADDTEGEEAYYTAVVQQVSDAYFEYSILSEEEKAAVTNAAKLMELEPIWSAKTLIDEITSDAPTIFDPDKAENEGIVWPSTSDFIELNLYDYGSNINDKYDSSDNIAYQTKVNGILITKYTSKYPGFQWNGGAYLKSTYDRHIVDYIDFGNSMITDLTYGSSSSNSLGKSSNAKDITVNFNYDTSGYGINAMDITDYGVTNRPVGMSLASSITDTSKDVLKRTLGSDGYPALKDGTSLSYLFQNGTYAKKQNESSIDKLFLQEEESGEYFFNSRLNHAQYDDSTEEFEIYDQIITPNFIVYPFGNFLPLNTITDGSKATQVSKIQRVVSGSGGYAGYMQTIINRLLDGSEDSTENQLIDMLAKYRDSLGALNETSSDRYTWTAADAINDYFHGSGDNPSDAITFSMNDDLLKKMYNIDWNVDTNFFFGMEMKMNFMQPKGGMTGNDTNGDGESDYPMKFYFTGDDDVWVYIDGVLFLDLSGIHRHVGGEIDFVNGKVHYYALEPSTGDVSNIPYKTYTFAELLTAAGKSTSGLNSKGTFTDYTTHEFKFFYMERGSGSSVCRLNFNFPLLRQNSISVEKEVTADTTILGDPDYRFQVLQADSSGNKTNHLFIAANTLYTIYDANDNKIGTGKTDANGVFTLKAGQRAEFTGINENAGKYYVRELLEGTVLGQYGNVTVSGQSTTTSNNVTVGSDTFTGMDSPVKDMSDGATAFRFTNDVDEEKVGTLNISKALTEFPQARAVRYFDIEVTLDGEKLPVGTKYTVGGTTKTVETAGIVTIAAGETATISNILAGTAFTVQETSGSAEGYTVTYTDSGGYTITVNDGKVNGVIKTSANVQLVVTNSEKGATVTIPGTKSLKNPDGKEHTYTFTLTEVTDFTGATIKEGGLSGYEATAAVTNSAQAFSFTINYAQVDVGSLPTQFYYRITENTAGDTVADVGCYVAEVTVSATTDGIAAAVTGMWKDGTEVTPAEGESYSADFVNTLVGDLALSKTVVGASPAEGFSFSIKLTDKDGNPVMGEFVATFYQQDGTVLPTSVTANDEDIIVLTSFMHSETAVIHGIPYGTTWTITETDNDGYAVTYTVNDVEVKNGAESTGSITTGDTVVKYTNTALYELPETGGGGVVRFLVCGGVLMAFPLLLLGFGRRRRHRGRRVQGG